MPLVKAVKTVWQAVFFYAIGNSVGIPYSIKSPAGQDRTAAER